MGMLCLLYTLMHLLCCGQIFHAHNWTIFHFTVEFLCNSVIASEILCFHCSESLRVQRFHSRSLNKGKYHRTFILFSFHNNHKKPMDTRRHFIAIVHIFLIFFLSNSITLYSATVVNGLLSTMDCESLNQITSHWNVFPCVCEFFRVIILWQHP